MCARHVFMCDTQAFNSSGAKAAVKYVCGDTQIHPHVDQNPDSLDIIIIIFLPSGWSSSLRALVPPPTPQPHEMPATASVCTKTNRCSGASETGRLSCAHRQHILLQHATEYAQTRRASASTTHQLHAKRRSWGPKTSSAAEESMDVLLLRAVKAAACLGCRAQGV